MTLIKSENKKSSYLLLSKPYLTEFFANIFWTTNLRKLRDYKKYKSVTCKMIISNLITNISTISTYKNHALSEQIFL